jgi:hypothetical protein
MPLMHQWDGQSHSNAFNGPNQIPTPIVYRCPSDPTMTSDGTTNQTPHGTETGFAITSYSFNGQVFGDDCGRPDLASSFPDGTSNTAFAFERYSICGSNGDVRTWGDEAGVDGHNEMAYYAGGSPGVAWVNANVSAIFQAMPQYSQCTSSTTQTSTPHDVMNVLLGDATVRSVNSSVSLAIWRSILTPNGDESVGLDN